MKDNVRRSEMELS